MWTRDIQHSTGVYGDYTYNNLTIYSARGVHEKVFELIKKRFPKKTAKILVLGAGAGAFDERLFDAGYKNITAVEFRKGVYKSKGKILILDLNTNFSKKITGMFDCIVAIEIIEHLENQFHFIRTIDSLLKKNGEVIVTSPNSETSLARVKFWLFGDIPMFTKQAVLDIGHINPIFSHIFLYYVKTSTNLKLIKIYTNTSVWNMASYETIKLKLMVAAAFFFSLFILNKDDRQILIFELKKIK